MAKKKALDYRVLLEMGGMEYSGKGSTLLEALSDMDKPAKFLNKGVLVMHHGDKKAHAVLHPLVIRKIVGNAFFRMIWQKLYAKSLA